MGTFHQNKHELHGITVVVETDGGAELFVGRCDDIDDERVILLDAAVHRADDDTTPRAAWLDRAARFGVWPEHRQLVLDRGRVSTIRRLGELA